MQQTKRCPLIRKCGGCQMQNLDYPRQLSWKQGRVIALLGKFGHVAPILGMETPYHYRNKVQAAFTQRPNGEIISGVYQAGTRRVVAVEHCLLEDEKADEIIGTVRELLKSFHLHPWDERTGRGFLRHVLVRRGFSTGETMVVLVAGNPIFPAKKFTAALLARHPDITTIVLNRNERHTAMVLGERERTLYGPGFIEDVLCGCRFRISPRSFYQINPTQCEVLYRTALDFAGLQKTDTVLDAYCGVGTIGLVAAAKAGQVLGVENNRDAVRDAVANAKRNHIANARFLCADATEFLTEFAKEGGHLDVLLMDPPRAGSTPPFLRAAAAAGPSRIVYISCNPETQARDLLELCKAGYRVRHIQPVDMFPHTNHIETVVLLSKLNTKQHIEVELNLDELDLTAAESKATYDEIKAYVLNKYGLKVSQLYIAQIKRKCGIIERKNYNVSKKEDAKVPQCPPEKEAAIMDALKHFQMI